MESVCTIDGTGYIQTSGFTGRVPWWSLTKTVLAAATLRLVEMDALALDASVDGESYTLRQLLRHESGLPDYGGLPAYHDDVAAGRAPWPVEHLLAATKADRLIFEPGAGWAYSNIGYLKIAQIVKLATALPLADALANLVFAPLGLGSARLATCPADLNDVEMASQTNYHPGWVYHGLVVGTVADACHLITAIASHRLLQPDTMAQMLDGRALPQFRLPGDEDDPAYGLGLMQRASAPHTRPFGHRGEGPGSAIAVFAQGNRTAGVWLPLPSDTDVTGRTLSLLFATPGLNATLLPYQRAASAWSSVHNVAIHVRDEVLEGKLPNGQTFISKDI